MDARDEQRAMDAQTAGGTVTATPPASERTKPYLVRELAEMWRVDKSTVYRMIYSRRLEAERYGPRRGAIRVSVTAVAKYLRGVADDGAEAVAS